MKDLIQKRLELLHERAPDSIGDLLRMEAVWADEEAGEYLLRARTLDWMRNAHGSLHGGMGATLVDQAMGAVAYCKMPGPGNALTMELNVSYHRPLVPGEDVLLRVMTLSVTRSLIRLECRAAQADHPDRLCVSATAAFFFKPQD